MNLHLPFLQVPNTPPIRPSLQLAMHLLPAVLLVQVGALVVKRLTSNVSGHTGVGADSSRQQQKAGSISSSSSRGRQAGHQGGDTLRACVAVVLRCWLRGCGVQAPVCGSTLLTAATKQQHQQFGNAELCWHVVQVCDRALSKCRCNLAVACTNCTLAPHSLVFLTHLLLTALHVLVSRQVAMGALSAAGSCQPLATSQYAKHVSPTAG
jgi:hypothetical protein